MIKKEFRDIIKMTIYSFTVSLIIPALKLFKITYVEKIDFSLLMKGLLAMVTIFLAILFGGSMFEKDRQENALEYLFTFPLNKSQIMVNKLIPRIAVLFPLVVGFVLYSWLVPQQAFLVGHISLMIDPLFLPVIVVFFFVSMMCHGLFEQKNAAAVVSVFTFYALVFITLGIRALLIRSNFHSMNPRYLDGLSLTITVFLLIALFLIAFIPAYKKADLKYLELKGTAYAVKVLIPMSLLMISGILAMIFM